MNRYRKQNFWNEIQHGKWHLEQYNTNQGETNGVETEEYQTNLVQNDYDKQKNNIKTSKIIEIKFNTTI